MTYEKQLLIWKAVGWSVPIIAAIITTMSLYRIYIIEGQIKDRDKVASAATLIVVPDTVTEDTVKNEIPKRKAMKEDQKNIPEAPKKEDNTQIVNDGGRAIQNNAPNYGQQALGDINNPPVYERNVAPELIPNFKKKLPKEAVDFGITIYNNDPESIKFAKKLSDALVSNGYNNFSSDIFSVTHGTYPNEWIGKIEVTLETPTLFTIVIYPGY